ncbi:MAG: ABC transporter ATP-binding protein [Hyphomicrobiaceae bacterium]|nr:MAG: ABC transporter ATP-binding protein [Hyphomicrobiaceae bacterium]
MAAVELENVSKRWQDVAAVDQVSFRTNEGDLVALLGPSGCGKSTTLRLIAGLETASSGDIRIGGEIVTGKPPSARGISMVFQSYALFPHLTVAENIIFGLRVRGVDAAERQKRLERASELLGLGGLLERKPSQLSGGQQQRVALGRAIVAETPVCLMDEPLSNLDAQLRLEMRREIRALQQRLGITMLYVTHDQVEAMTMADQVVLMRQGRIEQNGTPVELYERPATIFAARFVGTPPMNVVPLKALGEVPWLSPCVPRAAAEAQDLAVGIRPELIKVGEDGVNASLAAAEYLGGDSLIEARVADERMIVRAHGRVTAAPGSGIKLSWVPELTHWFSLSSGRRVE